MHYETRAIRQVFVIAVYLPFLTHFFSCHSLDWEQTSRHLLIPTMIQLVSDFSKTVPFWKHRDELHASHTRLFSARTRVPPELAPQQGLSLDWTQPSIQANLEVNLGSTA